MFKKSGATRLGDVLVSKGIITSEQLKHAIKEQTSRRKDLDPENLSAQQATSLGEILLELGYIDRLQLKRGLNWQLVLRKATMAMALCAPLLSFSSGAAAAVAKTVIPIPATIEAENYTTMLGVDTEATSDVGGGLNVGWIETGDWMSYTNTGVNLPTTGTYVITFRVSSESAGKEFVFYNVGGSETKICTVAVPNTGGYQAWVTVQKTVTLKAGIHYFKISTTTGGFNVNWFKITAASVASSSSSVVSSSPASSSKSSSSVASSVAPVSSSSSSSSVAPSSSSSSVSSVASSVSSVASSVASSAAPTSNLPFTIEAETYSSMSGVDIQETSDTSGVSNVGWIDPGDWMKYDNAVVNIPSTGQYILSYRVASGSGGGSFNLYEISDNTVYDTVTVSDTGAWQNWVTIKRAVTLTAGKHSFGIKSLSGGFNLNWFKVESASAASSTSSTSSTGSTATSSAPSSVSTSSTSSSSSSLSSSSGTTSSASSSSATTVSGPVGLSWVPPSQRQDGTVLDLTELGGYELRYRLSSNSDFTYISINDAWTTQYNFAWLEGNYVFQVAAFDKNGVYSDFVNVAGK